VNQCKVTACAACDTEFTLWVRRHHCRLCGTIFCARCLSKQRGLLNYPRTESKLVCHQCNPYAARPTATATATTTSASDAGNE
jgi:hypothetical protein